MRVRTTSIERQNIEQRRAEYERERDRRWRAIIELIRDRIGTPCPPNRAFGSVVGCSTITIGDDLRALAHAGLILIEFKRSNRRLGLPGVGWTEFYVRPQTSNRYWTPADERCVLVCASQRPNISANEIARATGLEVRRVESIVDWLKERNRWPRVSPKIPAPTPSYAAANIKPRVRYELPTC